MLLISLVFCNHVTVNDWFCLLDNSKEVVIALFFTYLHCNSWFIQIPNSVKTQSAGSFWSLVLCNDIFWIMKLLTVYVKWILFSFCLEVAMCTLYGNAQSDIKSGRQIIWNRPTSVVGMKIGPGTKEKLEGEVPSKLENST